MAPTGSWRGAAMVRATRSAAASSMPPARAEAGATMRWSLVRKAEAHGVRGDQADEPDRAGAHHRERRQGRAADEEARAPALQRQTDGARAQLAGREHVQRPREHDRGRHRQERGAAR